MNQDSIYRRPTTDAELCAWILALEPIIKKKEEHEAQHKTVDSRTRTHGST
jgi:hypothetical protein